MTIRSFARIVVLALIVPLLSGCEFDVTPMDIRTLEERTKSNDALACPAGLCRVDADFESPSFAVSVEELLKIAEKVIGDEPRTQLVAQDENLQQLVFVKRSRIFRFPDTVWIQGVRTGTGSAIIIYSRSNYGESDLGVNKKRVRAWLTKLTGQIQASGTGN